MNKRNLINNAKGLRREMTEAEELFWHFSRNRKMDGVKFRRQHPMAGFILDFYCAEKMICVEIDGGIHNDPEVKGYDEERTKKLEDHGVRVIRFTNEEVLGDIGGVYRRVVEFAGSVSEVR